uniref:PKD domain-containing protein n=1 Tax=Fluviicola sp. TaxID=1917219 RepID=UPI00261E9413
AANTVVADFTLPYLCCSDCRPVGFIMPEIIADLRLSSDQVCLKSLGSATVDMYRYPADGVVELSPTVQGITVVGDQLKIEATKFPESAYGQVLHFTLNGHPTNAELTVHKAVAATLVAPANPITSLTVPFDCKLPTNVSPSDFTYFWDFGDGTTATDKSPTHTYSSSTNTVIVRLTVNSVTDNMCPLTTEKELEFDVNNNWPPDPVTCKLESEAYFLTQRALFDQTVAEMGLDGGVASAAAPSELQQIITDFGSLYDNLFADMPGYQNGNYNKTVGPTVRNLASRLFDQVVIANDTGVNKKQLVDLYHNLMRSGVSVVRCQEEAIFNQFAIMEMIAAFKNALDPGITPSFPSMGILSGKPINVTFLDEVLTQRQEGSASWNAISALRTNVIWKP